VQAIPQSRAAAPRRALRVEWRLIRRRRWLVPPMFLQPLVENAVLSRHRAGIEPGLIEVRVDAQRPAVVAAHQPLSPGTTSTGKGTTWRSPISASDSSFTSTSRRAWNTRIADGR